MSAVEVANSRHTTAAPPRRSTPCCVPRQITPGCLHTLRASMSVQILTFDSDADVASSQDSLSPTQDISLIAAQVSSFSAIPQYHDDEQRSTIRRINLHGNGLGSLRSSKQYSMQLMC